ncbi:MAG: MOSC domain-containing protein [Longimicrobiaceae bacterium]
MRIGTIREIWRFPVKSMAGERLDAAVVTPSGIPGDRGWATRDEAIGEMRGAKYLPKLMLCSAAYREPPDASSGSAPHVDITLPDGTRTASDDPEVNARLSDLLGRPVTLWPLRPAEDRAHYKRAHRAAGVMGRISRIAALRPHLGKIIRTARLEAPVREIFDRQPDEELPDFDTVPSELFAYTTPPGTYFDLAPLHLLTTASLAAMERINPSAEWDVRRFRPNFLVETEPGIEGLVEAEWSGRTLRIGELAMECWVPAVRCGMTTHAQEGLPKDPSVLRSIVRDAGQNLGVYGSATSAARVRVGDAVELL